MKMNDDIKKALQGLRDFIAFVAKLTPTQYDDELVRLLDYLLGNQSQAKAQALDIPWDKLLQLIMPYLLQLLAKWLEGSGNGGSSVDYNPGTTPIC